MPVNAERQNAPPLPVPVSETKEGDTVNWFAVSFFLCYTMGSHIRYSVLQWILSKHPSDTL